MILFHLWENNPTAVLACLSPDLLFYSLNCWCSNNQSEGFYKKSTYLYVVFEIGAPWQFYVYASLNKYNTTIWFNIVWLVQYSLNTITNCWLKYIFLALTDATHLYINKNQEYYALLYIRSDVEQIVWWSYCEFLPNSITISRKINKSKNTFLTSYSWLIDDSNNIVSKIDNFRLALVP